MQAFRLVRARAYKGIVWYLKVCLRGNACVCCDSLRSFLANLTQDHLTESQ